MNAIGRVVIVASAVMAWFPAPIMAAPPAVAQQVDGFTEPYRTINVAALDPGVITRLDVREGDVVRKGQVLAMLDYDLLEASRGVAEAGRDAVGRLYAAEAALRLKHERLKNLTALHAQGHAYQEEVDRADSELRIAESEVLVAKEDQLAKSRELSRIEVQVERRKIRSPIDGVVTRLQKQIGEFIPATDTSLLTLVQIDRLLVVLPVPRSAAAKLHTGDSVELHFADGLRPVKAAIESICAITDPESGTVRVRVTFDNADSKYPSGVPCWLKLGSESLASAP
jgi:RND family efflux transporter MFP subunit